MRPKTKSTNPTLRKIDALCQIERYGDALTRLENLDLRRLKPVDIEHALRMDLECAHNLGIPFYVSERWARALAEASARDAAAGGRMYRAVAPQHSADALPA